ncbi:acetyl-CoA synthetase-like protein [Trichoderma sp. SZMC 28015]
MEDSVTRWVLAQIGAMVDIPASNIGMDQTFIEIGGNSLSAVKLAAICRQHGVQLSVESVLGSRDVASILNSAVQATPKSATPVPDTLSSTDDDDERDDSDYISEGTSTDSNDSDMSLPSDSNPEKHTPMTEMQLALIYGTQRYPARNIINYFETHPPHRLSVLRRAWETVIRMEPIFRTKFDLRNSGQLIEQAEAPFIWRELTVTDWTSYRAALDDLPSLLDIDQSDEGCQVMLGNRFEAITLLDDDSGTHISTIVWRVHHALVDGYSANLLLQKVRRVAAGMTVQPSPSFTGVAARLYQLQQASAETAKQFWQQRYAQYPSASSQLLLPSPQEASETPKFISFQSPIDLTITAKQNGITVAAICYAAWALVLTLFTDSDTVIFGAVLSGRNLPIPDIDEAIGPLVNTLPIHIHVDYKQTIRQFLKTVFHGLVELASFQWSLPEHGFNRHFASALSMQFDMSSVDSQEMPSPIERPYSLSQTDIPISIFIETDGTFRLQYHPNVFQTQDMQTLSEQYQQALSILSRPSDTEIGQYQDDLLTQKSRDTLRLFGNWDSAQARLPSIKDNLTSLFQRTAGLYPDHIAVEKGDSRLTYSELHTAASKVAKRLSPFIAKGDVVCLHADRSVEWICGIYGILLAGAVYCPLDANLPHGLRESYYASAAAKVFLSPFESQIDVKPTGCTTAMSIEESLRDTEAIEKNTEVSSIDHQAPAYICFTSGSTGKPKGVICTHTGLVAFQSDWTVRLKAQPGWKIAQTMSVAFDGSIHEIFSTLSYGATLVLPSSVDPFAHLSRVNACILTPSIAKVLDMTQFASLDTIYLVGEPVPTEVNDHISEIKTLYNMYGPTEGTGGATIGQLLPGKPVTIGRPNPSTRVYIMNRDLALVPPGVIGEICIAGVQTALGYIGLPKETAERFRADPVCKNLNAMMYRTGDHGYWDAQSQEIVYLGRKDRMIKLRGYRLDLNDLEARILMADPSVSAVAVAVAHKEDYLVAMVTPGSIDTAHLATRMRDVLPVHAVPRRVIAVDQFPMTAAGKRDYKAISTTRPEAAATVVSVTVPVAKPLTPTESRVSRLWRSVLDPVGSKPIGREDNFYNLGGHSILQLHLATALSEEFGCHVPIRLVMKFPVLHEMAHMMDRLMLQTMPGEMTVLSQRKIDEQELSPIELEWWQKYELNEGSSAFNVCFAARFDPAHVDRRLLTAAWNTVLMRHRILRSLCVRTRRLGVRRKYADCPPQVERLDQLNLWFEVNRPFQLNQNHPIRVIISRDTMLVVVSHIVCDLTTLEILNQEVISLYRGEPLPKTQQQRYIEVVAQNTTTSARDLDFWTKYLAGSRGSDNSFEVNFDRSSYRGSSFVIDVPPATFAGMTSLVAAQHLTLHQVALAAIALTLQVEYEQIDVVLGGPHFNRKTLKARKTIGLFLEPLPIRIRGDQSNKAQTVADFLHEVQHHSQQALGHAVAWNQLLCHLGVEMDYPNHPLFDIMVTFHDHRDHQLFQLPGFEPLPIWAKGSKFKLMFEFTAVSADKLMLRIEHDPESYPQKIVHQIAQLLLTTLQLLVQGGSYTSLRTELRQIFASMKTA